MTQGCAEGHGRLIPHIAPWYGARRFNKGTAMYPNTAHRWCTRLILRLSGAFLGCASIASHADDLSSATNSNGFMTRGALQRPAAAGNPRPDFVLPLTGGRKGGIASLLEEECEEEDEAQPAAAVSQQAPVLAVAAPTLATHDTPQARLPPPIPKEEATAVAPPAPVAEWELTPSDKTLNTALSRWATKAGWQLVWEFPHDYEIDVRSTVPGTFEEAIEAVAKSIDTAEAPMRVIFYKGNKVLRIVARGRE